MIHQVQAVLLKLKASVHSLPTTTLLLLIFLILRHLPLIVLDHAAVVDVNSLPVIQPDS